MLPKMKAADFKLKYLQDRATMRPSCAHSSKMASFRGSPPDTKKVEDMKTIKRKNLRKHKKRILDLHSTSHEEVPEIVSSFLYKSIDNNRMPVEIITGKSSAMKEIVGRVVDYMGYMSVRESAQSNLSTLTIDYEEEL